MGANDAARPPARRPDGAGQPSRAAPLGEAAVTGHNRPSRLQSIRIRILLPVILATAGLVGLGVIQTEDAIAQTRQGDRARVLARMSNAVVTLIHELEREYVETNALRHRGGEAGSQLLVAQRARTDTARTRYVTAGRDARAAVPTLGPSLANADAFLDRIPAAREIALANPEGAPQVFNAYNDAAYALLAVADAIPAQLTDPQLVEIARAVVLVAEVEHLAAEQLDVLRRAFTLERLPTSDLVRLARLAGAEGQRLTQLKRIPGPAAPRYADLVAGPDVETSIQARDRVLSQPTSPEALGVDPDVWYVAQSGYLRRLRLMEVALAGEMERASYDVQIAGQRRIALTTGLTLLVVVIVLAGSGVLAVRTSRRLRQMREAALTVARTELPNAIARVTAATEPAAVRGALQDSSTRFDSMLTTGADEIGELSTAFGAVHRQALRLAADQAMLRMDVEAIFVGLARRGQTLVQRQIQLIDQFGEAEPDPATRTRLLALDHVATRMRRNEENLLVLAGGEPGRRFTAPVSLRRVIRAAAREIEDYQRVDAFDIPPVAISAQAARDVIHLLAELLENATSFSPPHTPVRVSARSTVEGLTITVYDEGI
ncbi:MAG TPA: nitrate- and nitrite sensing domain-containing protein, partial [Micromonosporaceae bacterium]|nr:nitrate- and nitrite sensing domain-containing protein [Micromonosporaceae bacterium]